MRDHNPVPIPGFNGLWRRGSVLNCPPDHFTDSINLRYLDDGVTVRPGVQPFQDLANPLGDVLRQYNYILPSGSTLLVLVDGGEIYHVTDAVTANLILTIPGMTDFGFTQFGTNAYISPAQVNSDGQRVGMQNEVVYIFNPTMTVARPTGAAPPVDGDKRPFWVTNNTIAGEITAGVHYVAVAYVTGGTPDGLGPEVFPLVIAPGSKTINLFNIPIGGVGVTARLIAMTKALPAEGFVYNPAGQTWYEAGTINNNIDSYQLISVSDANLTNDVTALFGDPDPPVTNALLASPGVNPGYSDTGFRLIAVVYETNTGFLTRPGPEHFAGVTTINPSYGIDLANIPTSPDSNVIRRHIIASKINNNFYGDVRDPQYFFVPGGTINDNTTTVWSINFFDSELLEDASYLLYQFNNIPAGVILSKYKNRLVSIAEYDNISLARVSLPNEPESVSELDGFILFPPNGKPLTNAMEFRDVLHLYQDTKTIAYVDNGEEPASWQPLILDNGFGTQNFGIATVLDSGGINVDYLIVAGYSGIMLFNGMYVNPELSYKIFDFWRSFDPNELWRIQLINDTTNKILYVITPDGNLLVGNYTKGLTPKDIRWGIWRFDFLVRTIQLINTDTLIIGAYEARP